MVAKRRSLETKVGVEVDAGLVAEARRLGIDVERAANTALRRRVEKRRASFAWEQENQAGIDAFNRYIEEYGTVGEEFRRQR
ncbi:MAG TPA: type II toxin-antitoxin system CcdA family antitoxin [Hyphomicrobiales bacterium]|nr:type II toxin-antitoxin system CcdA family antitoxin [Hyphomicrobiales bacterium]